MTDDIRNAIDAELPPGRVPFAIDSDAAVAAGRRATRRRRYLAGGGAAGSLAAAAAALAMVLPLGGTSGGSTEPAEFPNVQFPPELENAVGRGMGVEFYVEFYDTRHGYATYQGDACNRSWISATRDGGASWGDLRELPRLSAQELSDLPSSDPIGEGPCFQPYLVPIAEETLVMLATLEPQIAYDWLAPPTTAYISHDAGESWQEYEPKVRTVDTVPDGVMVGRHCEDEACEEAGLGWYDPETGDRMVLRDTPAVAPTRSRQPVIAADGSIWVAEIDDDFRIMVSRDRGRSWQDRTPDQLGGIEDGGTAFTTSDGETAHLWAGPSDGLYRTVDGGETWQDLPAGQPFTEVASMRIAPDGTLVVGELQEGTQYVSSDGGETFHATGLPLWDVSPLVTGWYGFLGNDANGLPTFGYLSDDGLTWRPVRIPMP